MKTRPAIHPSLVRATIGAMAEEAEVRIAAQYLAEVMRDIHGGNWKIDICHEHQFIMIVNRARDNDPVKPKQGGVV